ncbi:MAG: hypothetical protein K5984_01635 [Bacteroidales bacterium]|nr:hypothetical protein [Bacteroidales bacterium]
MYEGKYICKVNGYFRVIVNVLAALIASGALVTLQAKEQPSDLYNEYITPETSAVLKQFQELEERLEAEAEEEKARNIFAIAVSLVISLVPLISILSISIKMRAWENNPTGFRQAIGISVLAGVAMFAFNYCLFWMRHRMGDELNFIVALLFVIGLTGVCLHYLHK